MVAMTKEKAKKLEASLDQNSISFPFPSRQGLDWRSRTVARRIEREKRGSHATLSKGIKGQEQAAATSGCVCVYKGTCLFPSFLLWTSISSTTCSLSIRVDVNRQQDRALNNPFKTIDITSRPKGSCIFKVLFCFATGFFCWSSFCRALSLQWICVKYICQVWAEVHKEVEKSSSRFPPRVRALL